MSNSDSSLPDPAQSRSGVVAQSCPAPVQVRCWSSHCVRVGDFLSGSCPHGVGSVSGSSRLGQVGSRSVRLRLSASDSGSGPVWLGSSVSGSCPAASGVGQGSACGAPAPSKSETSCPAPALRGPAPVQNRQHGPARLQLCPTWIHHVHSRKARVRDQ